MNTADLQGGHAIAHAAACKSASLTVTYLFPLGTTLTISTISRLLRTDSASFLSTPFAIR